MAPPSRIAYEDIPNAANNEKITYYRVCKINFPKLSAPKTREIYGYVISGNTIPANVRNAFSIAFSFIDFFRIPKSSVFL